MFNNLKSSTISKWSLIVFSSVAGLACNPQQTSSSSEFTEPSLLAMRSTLDGETRIISLKLGNDITAAYDTKSSKLFKLWQGETNLTGAVFDQKHGPQPKTSGQTFVENGQAEWSAGSGTVSYHGHQINDQDVSLLYQAKGTLNGKAWQADISETPSASNQNGQLVFVRHFRISGLPDKLNLQLQHLYQPIDTKLAGPIKYDKVNQTLSLQNGESHFTATYSPLEKSKQAEQNSAEKIHPGLALIQNSDCAACHNAEVKTVGPAYSAIAQRYATISGAKDSLSEKIIQGGSGNWGDVPMTPHAQLTMSDANVMLDYIFTLVPTQSSSADDNDILLGVANTAIHLTNQTPEFSTELRGAYLYQTGFLNGDPDEDHVRTSTAVLGAFVEQIHFPHTESLGPAANDFMYQIKTSLALKQPLKTRLRLVADDGAYLYLNGQRIINNWGFHAAEAKDAEVNLSAGLHPIEIIYFQAGGGGALSLQWLNPATEKYEIIPAAMLKVQKQDVREVKGVVTDPDIIKTIPGDKREVAGIHPSFDLSQARPDEFKPMVGGIDFLDDGRMVVSTWDPEGSVYLVSDYQASPQDIKVKRIAKGLAEPLGVKVVDGDIYVLQKQELTRLVDTNQDGFMDRYELVSNDWATTANFHEFAFGLEYENGYFYAALATAILPGGASTNPQAPSRGKVLKISKDTGEVEFVAHGLRTPNSIGRGIDNKLFIADNQGDWVPACKIVELTPGAWYGSRSVDFEGTANLTETLPVVWLPQGDIGNSASQPAPLNVGPYKNQMIHGDVTHGGIKRVFAERIDGRLQGAVFRFSQGLEAGVNRLKWAPNGSLIVGGVGNPGNWAHSDKKWYGLQSLTYNENSTFEMLSVSARSDGFEITLTEPIKQNRLIQADDFEIQQWYFEPTADYGGPKKDQQALTINALTVSKDRTKIQLKLDGLKENHVVYFRIKRAFESENNHELWTTEAWYTLNKIPQNKPVELNQQYSVQHNTLSPSEISQGWSLLFDGQSLGHFRNYNQQTAGTRWGIDESNLFFAGRTPEETGWQTVDGGDLVITPKPVENFELNLEWKVQQGGNSGIIYNVKELPELEFPFLSGPEMQILDNPNHSDGQLVKHRAGDNYDLIKSKFVSVLPAGEWNQVRLVVNQGHVEHWLNGYQLVDVQMFDDNWKALIAASKFKDWPHFAKTPGGHIVLQDHGDQVWFRNIKIKQL
ncbi:family 16 glycoside hydrolase [Paraglaciecola sp. L3A3]|uniref:family 16 glycoside hydrolase n=1 Tax=Paraglaciecola sp. L3A3 TaxID=2686358 RepID=UPI00131E6D31|nr:family 16 glycoside hydrolase [Paraglaciecola sp. L3A3]